MSLYFQRAIKDIKDNKFLHTITVFTTALSILLVSSFALFYTNANEMIKTWKNGVRLFVYLDTGIKDDSIETIKNQIAGTYGIKGYRFIPKEDALKQLKLSMKNQQSLFDNLSGNPLPDSFEIFLLPSFQTLEHLETLSEKFSEIPEVEDIEYGQKWLKKFLKILQISKFTGGVMGFIFFIVTIFIISNTIKLSLFSRQEEIEIMRLVGASDEFIQIPFYIEGIIQGASGGMIGLFIAYIPFYFISHSLDKSLAFNMFSIHFFSFNTILGIFLGSIFVGWLGCFLSLRQYLKKF